MQFKGVNLPFQAFQGIAPRDPGNRLFLPAALEDYILHHPAAEKLQAEGFSGATCRRHI